MAGNDIANKVKIGLAKANDATGGGNSVINLNKKVTVGGGSPLNPGVTTVTPILLVDAIVKSYNIKLIDGELIRAGDIQLVSNGDVDIVQNEEIDVNSKKYIVISVDVKSPANVPLAYISQLRAQ